MKSNKNRFMNSSQRLVLVLFIVCILAGVVSGSAFYFRLAYVWFLLLAGSWLMSWQALRGIVLKRSVRTHRSQVGQIFEERFEIINSGKLPRVWIEIRDESSLPGAKASHVISVVKGGESRSYLARTRLVKRGVYELGPTVLAAGDFFGLFPVNKKCIAEDSILVYPMMVNIDFFPSPAGWLPGGEAIRRRTQQITTNAAGVREYAPGDPMNRIHWLSTARRDRFIVKEFELDPLAEVWIFLDAYKYAQASLPYEAPQFEAREQWRPVAAVPLEPSTLEYGVTIAASLSRYFLRHNRAVGFVSASRTLKMISSDRGLRQLGKIFEALAIIDGDGNLPIEGVVESQSKNVPRGSTAIIISPAAGKGIPLAVEDLFLRGFKPVVIYINGGSFGKSGNGDEVNQVLAGLRIPYCTVSQGDDISARLSACFKSSAQIRL